VTTTPTAGDQPLGSISFALQLGASIQIDSVEYAVTGPGGFQRIGSLDVSRSTTVSGIIGDLPAGAGYTLALTATDVNQRLAVCRGSATFDVVPRTDTPVSIHMTCLEAPTQSVPLSPLAMLALAAALVMAGTAALGRRRADSKR
jgi:hypothetical protein